MDLKACFEYLLPENSRRKVALMLFEGAPLGDQVLLTRNVLDLVDEFPELWGLIGGMGKRFAEFPKRPELLEASYEAMRAYRWQREGGPDIDFHTRLKALIHNLLTDAADGPEPAAPLVLKRMLNAGAQTSADLAIISTQVGLPIW